MIIDCIGCLHGSRPNLEGGDLLIITGDLTARDNLYDHSDILNWLNKQDYKKKILVPGNHDGYLAKHNNFYSETNLDYLVDSGVEFQGLKIWGSPWTKTFKGMNPKCMTFTKNTEKQLEKQWKLIPRDTNILITHGPSYSVLDGIPIEDGSLYHVGSKSLNNYLDWDAGLRLHVFSHIHEGYGEYKEQNSIFSTHSVNCSIMDRRYRPINAPIRVIL